MTDEVTTYLRNLSDYELMKRLHKARPDKFPNPDTDPDLQADGAERIDGDDDEHDNETTREKRLIEIDAKAMASVVSAARSGDAEAIDWLKTCKVDQSWRLDPANDHRQPEVAKHVAELIERLESREAERDD